MTETWQHGWLTFLQGRKTNGETLSFTWLQGAEGVQSAAGPSSMLEAMNLLGQDGWAFDVPSSAKDVGDQWISRAQDECGDRWLGRSQLMQAYGRRTV